MKHCPTCTCSAMETAALPHVHLAKGGRDPDEKIYSSRDVEALIAVALAASKHTETDKPLANCPYCKRPADDTGGIFHAGGCAGLENVDLNRLQYDALVKRGSALKAGEKHGV